MDATFIANSSRYQRTPLYVDTQGNQFWGLWERIEFPARSDDRFTRLRLDDGGLRLDRLAQLGLNDFSMWWVLCEANAVRNPFTELGDQSTLARTNVVLSADNRTCFYVQAKAVGKRYNTTAFSGLKVLVFATALHVYWNNKVVERFTSLSPYPLTAQLQLNPNFWGSVVSDYITVVWVNRDASIPPVAVTDATAPTPPGTTVGKEYQFFGGEDAIQYTLRVPSLTHTHERLAV